MAVNCDILIVGGGVMGISIAWQLAKRRCGRVVLLEKSFLGAGSSGKSGAIVRQHYSNKLTASMAQKSLRIYEQFPDVVGGPPVFTRTGMVLIVNEKDKPGLDVNLKMQQELGIDVRAVPPQVLADIDPNARLKEDEIAVYEAEAGYVEAVQVVASYAEAARREGADIRLGVEVLGIVTEKGKMVGVETNEGRYNSPCVVLATGPWAAQLGKDLGVKLPVQACRTQVALYRRPPDFGRRSSVYCDFVQGIYFKPTHGEMIHAGSLAGEEISQPVDPDKYNEAAEGDWLPMVRQRLSRRYPAMHRGYGRGGYGASMRSRPTGIQSWTSCPTWRALLRRRLLGPRLQDVAYCGPTDGRIDRGRQSVGAGYWAAAFARFDENDPVKTPYSYGVMG